VVGVDHFPIYKKGDETDCSNSREMSLMSTTYGIVSNILLSMLTPSSKEIIGIHRCGFDATGQILIVYSACVKYVRKYENTTKQCGDAVVKVLRYKSEGRWFDLFACRQRKGRLLGA
jgi:hypothetical protein